MCITSYLATLRLQIDDQSKGLFKQFQHFHQYSSNILNKML